ncbi:hypothetical protein A2313_04660 [Candidatus Roizmanbacteria bacterium RIFOXYB2_FULL_41_10]|nr:MAG: hypothetical protein A2377_01170 [Candidatus Roizmanbacteria bacterium RIFOXYB1_FULL_41_27]OGK67739.1 MAG: hypothetical protein A2262_01655 [Candidatus Roizmanbacteria bacterium RIFOXYA2_FULL_41_8]OGK69141.1 MAG: hypothetical protein A2313_04660 [Candidatus Roizmanbacteria bacterium RIFOXYB2_FULL_41_10]OGK72073.1 MAG: hypothetical protein A2403_03935 [Candidatus Roizmanbacteria bacterium RIFOXYC1_FULL_41_16]
MLPIILASGSKNRRTIMDQLGISYQIQASNFDEHSIKTTNISKRAQLIALGKARQVAQKHQGLIISADTFTVFDNQIMEKPRNLSQAREMLRALSGHTAVSYTGFCFLNTQSGFVFNKTAPTKIVFRDYSDSELKQYLAKYPVTTWAAGYALIDPYLSTLAAKLQGSLVGLTHGLPTEWLIPLLEKEGYQISLK